MSANLHKITLLIQSIDELLLLEEFTWIYFTWVTYLF